MYLILVRHSKQGLLSHCNEQKSKFGRHMKAWWDHVCGLPRTILQCARALQNHAKKREVESSDDPTHFVHKPWGCRPGRNLLAKLWERTCHEQVEIRFQKSLANYLVDECYSENWKGQSSMPTNHPSSVVCGQGVPRHKMHVLLFENAIARSLCSSDFPSHAQLIALKIIIMNSCTVAIVIANGSCK